MTDIQAEREAIAKMLSDGAKQAAQEVERCKQINAKQMASRLEAVSEALTQMAAKVRARGKKSGR